MTCRGAQTCTFCPVSITVQQLVAEARQLPQDELADLVELLLAEAAKPYPEVDEAWKIETRRRIAEIESCQADFIPGERVLGEMRKKVGL